MKRFIIILIITLATTGWGINGATFAIYVGPGAWSDGVTAFQNFLDWKGISWEIVTPTDVNTYVLKDYYQAIFMPGGDAYYYKLYIDANGIQHIRDLVASGGGYFGTCAGAYFASDSIRWEGGKYDYPLDLFQGFSNGAIDTIAPWADYTMTDIHLNMSNPINQYSPSTMTSLYYGGQTFVPYPGVTVDTLFTWAAYYDSVGGIAFTYGNGRVILTGTHPEIDENTDRDGTTFADSLDDKETDWNWLWSAMDWLLKKPITTPQIWVNELHYDNAGSDQNELIEVAIPTTIADISSLTVTLYDGATGDPYASYGLSAFIPGIQQNGLQLYYLYTSNIQDGPDGIAIDHNGTVQQFISYEGTFTANSGVAAGITSKDIGVAESGTDPAGMSLQMLGNGTAWPDFSWGGPYAQTPGQVNSDGTTDQALPVTLESFTANYRQGSIFLTWTTASEINNEGFILERKSNHEPAFIIIATYQTHDALQGAGSSNSPRNYRFQDSHIVPGNHYTYRLKSVDYQGKTEILGTISIATPSGEDIALNSITDFRLLPPFPNPFNSETIIAFTIPATSSSLIPTRVTMWDARGQLIKTLLNRSLPSGTYELRLLADGLSSGLYFIKLEAGHWRATHKLILVR